MPVRSPVDLARAGTVIDKTISFKYGESYCLGFAFYPSIAPGGRWNVSDFGRESAEIWKEFDPAVDVSLTDSAGVLRMRDVGEVSGRSGWYLTNGGSGGEEPASVYKFLTFKPEPGARYRVRVVVTRGFRRTNRLRPVFFIERPIVMP